MHAELQTAELRFAGELLFGLVDLAHASFADLARVWSDDASGQNGGSVGWVRKGLLPDEVEEATWALQPGQHTAPILTDRGLYIVHVDSTRTEDGETTGSHSPA